MINSLYVIKYGERQNYVSVEVLISLYVALILLFLVGINQLKKRLNQLQNFKNYFIGMSVFVFIIIIAVNVGIDGESLNVLRWKGMNTTISAILDGNYPYTTFLDAKGDTTSNFPGLFYLGLPFYLLGDVGYLQGVTFLLVSYCIYTLGTSNYLKVVILFLLLGAISFWWEIVAKSDLMSTVFLLSLFIMWWAKKYSGDYFKKPILLAFIVAFFLLTRLIVVIPLILFLLHPFFKTTIRTKVTFLSFLLFFLVLISLPIILTIPSFEVFLNYNPMNNQSGEAPIYLTIAFLILSCIFSKRKPTSEKILSTSFFLIISLVFLRFILNVFQEGYDNNMYGNFFDISYFGMAIPFLIFTLSIEKNTMRA